MLRIPSRSAVTPAIVLAALTLLLAAVPRPVAGAPPEEPAAERVVVQYRSAQATAQALTTAEHALSLADQGFRTVAVPEGKTAEEFLAELEQDPAVISAEADAPVYAAADPNDPYYFSSQAGYFDTLNAPAAWDLHTGNNQVVVAVIDSGLDVAHPDFVGRLWENPLDADSDGVDDDNNGCIDDRYGCRFLDLTPERQTECGYTSSVPSGAVMDDNGNPGDLHHSHGTMVAGIIGAAGNNGAGVSGVAWDVRLMPIKALDCGVLKNGGSPNGEMSNVARAIDYARRMGANIINLSLASNGTSGDIQMLRTAITEAESAGIIVVAAAGNGSGSGGPGYPARYTQYTNVIGVGASQTAAGNTWATYSLYGPGVDLAAPGDNLATTGRSDIGPDYVSTGSGTSFSTPLVTGMFALMHARNSGLTMPEYIDIVLENASPAVPAPHGGNWAGAGIADIGAAVAALPMAITGSPQHDWMDVPPGALIRAMIGSVDCGSTVATAFGPLTRYAIHVLSDAEKGGCGRIGRAVRLTIDGRPAEPTFPWSLRNQDLSLRNRDVSSVSPPPGSIVVQTLAPGWSLVAQFPPGEAMPHAVSYLPGDWARISRLENGGEGPPRYASYGADAPRYAQSLLEVEQFDVLWVNGEAANLALPNPEAPPRSVDLYTGWNVFLYTGPHRKVEEALGGIAGSYAQVLRYDNAAGAWQAFLPGQARYLNGFGGLMELQVYWIQMAEPGVLEME